MSTQKNTGRHQVWCTACGGTDHLRKDCHEDVFCKRYITRSHTTEMCHVCNKTGMSNTICIYCGSINHISTRCYNKPNDNREEARSTPRDLIECGPNNSQQSSQCVYLYQGRIPPFINRSSCLDDSVCDNTPIRPHDLAKSSWVTYRFLKTSLMSCLCCFINSSILLMSCMMLLLLGMSSSGINSSNLASTSSVFMIVSIGNWYKVLNQVPQLIIKLPGQYQLKNNTCIFINTLKWWKCGPPNNMIHCAGICMNLLLWEKILAIEWEIFVNYNSCPLLCLYSTKIATKIVINFSISMQ